MLNAEPDTTSDILSENGPHDTSIASTLPSSRHPSPHRPGRLTQSKSAYGTASPKGPDPWATTLAAIRKFSSPPDPMWNSPDLLGRPASAGAQLRPRGTDDHDPRTFSVTVVEELPNSLFALRWHDPTLCYYGEQVWVPSRARSLGRCALSGKHINRGDSVYRPQTRARAKPLNLDAVILASEMVKVRTSV
ncbi:MAG: hypothetical protein JWR14_3582 [Caballeronia sp.]|jgi:hypothetical protein|uniref:DUF3331 domain-containing protein n=1 Tax=Caballeronia sp. TaxID=1931223 RepID=UPI002A4A79A7|nr:hypothetical protein [Caballeronia sp.]